jgi:hypothetical protein
MAAPSRASAKMTAVGELEIRTPYCDRTRLLVADLKSTVPGRYRRWDATEKVWRVRGAYAATAIDLLVAYDPNAELPSDRVAVVPERTDACRRPLPPLPVPEMAPPADDQPERDYLVASVRCPKCGQRHDQPIRVIAQTSPRVAKRDTITPEVVSICPACNGLAVVAFVPAAAAAVGS